MLLVVEGGDGSGKTSIIPIIKSYIEKKGRDCLTTREPGGTKIGAEIRKILLNPDNTNLAVLSELFLYAADRAQHFNQVIKPALDKGMIVLSDRFNDSTWTYQGYVRGHDIDIINRLDDMILNGIEPIRTFLLDVPVEIGLSRAKGDISNGNRNIDESRFENEKMTFHEKVREGYLLRAKQESHRFRVIDASKSIPEVVDQIIKEIDKIL